MISRNSLKKRNVAVSSLKNVKRLEPEEIKVDFDDVIGHRECKKDLSNILNFLENSERYEQYGIVPYCKYIILGPEGTGKTTLACSVAKKAGLPIYVIEPSFFFNEDEVLKQIDILFKEVDGTYVNGSGCMLLFKNIEYFSAMDNTILNSIVDKLIGCFRERQELVAFATISNDDACELPKLLTENPAFSKIIEVSLPEIQSREEILKLLLKGLPIDESLDTRRLALEMYQMSFGAIKSIVRDAGLLAMQNNQTQLEYTNFAEALAQSSFGYVGNKLNEAERLATARHEAGHVLAGYYASPETYKVTKVEITPRSYYAGITESAIDEEKVGYFREELEERIIMSLGGMASEEFFYNSTTTGVTNDLLQATHLAVEIVKSFGMSKEIGPIALTNDYDSFKGLHQAADKEIQALMKEMYARTLGIIREHSAQLNKLVDALIEKEVLYTEEVMAILNEK